MGINLGSTLHRICAAATQLLAQLVGAPVIINEKARYRGVAQALRQILGTHNAASKTR